MTLKTIHLSVAHNKRTIISDISVKFPTNAITCLIGPSGAGKSTLIRALNRMNETVDGFTCTGHVLFHGRDVRTKPAHDIRRQIGMVFQKPVVFPRSIYENVVFGLKQFVKRSEFDRIVEEKLRAVSLWKEVKDRLHDSALSLSVGQQQRLCIARTLAVEPEIILMDEPTSALDPVATAAIEDLMLRLREKYLLIVVTHDLKQARKIADYVLFLSDGKLIEHGSVQDIFEHPQKPETLAYVKSHE